MDLLEDTDAIMKTVNEQLWINQDVAFERLKLLLETPQPEEHDSVVDNEKASADNGMEVNPASARVSALPTVKLFAVGTHLLRIDDGDPLLCFAFGTIDPIVYTEIFWEAIAAATDVSIRVYDVRTGPSNALFELSLPGGDFKILYLQCNDLLRNYPDVISAPSTFLKDPKNGCLHVCDTVETLKIDQKRLKEPQIDVARKSYRSIIELALATGRMGLGEAKRLYLKPKDILNIVFDFLASVKGPVSREACMKHFLQAVDSDYSGPMAPVHQLPKMYAQRRLNKVSPRVTMVYSNYLQISVIFTCSPMSGAKWLSMVEQRLWAIPKTGHGGGPSCTIWPSRLEADWDNINSKTRTTIRPETPYEGFYVVGYNEGDFIVNAIDKMIERAAKDKDNIPGECFISVKSFRSSEFDTTFRVSERDWPRKPISNPLEQEDKSQAQLDPPVRTKYKKVHKDGKKGGKERTYMDMNPDQTEAHTKLRPASDVLTRLKYDPNIDIDEFVVGYADRHTSQMQEKPAASWQRDTTHEEFIPEHRIQYFKKMQHGGAEEIMWDRGSRMDKIFKESSKHESSEDEES